MHFKFYGAICLFLVFFLVTLSGCGGDPAEPVSTETSGEELASTPEQAASSQPFTTELSADDVRKRQVDLLEAYIQALEAADAAPEVAAAIRSYNSGLEKLVPALIRQKEQPAEIEGSPEDPEKLARFSNEIQRLTQRLLAVSRKVQRYSTDPEVARAQAELKEVQARL